MMDERLIAEVQKHAIIYNRQKSNMINGDKCITKEIAWQDIARNLATDVDSCKKRWKYLRERYVQQKKVGDSPSYEHLSRPYLEKMKFLDNFIQPRKSYRNVGMFPGGAASAMQHMFDGNESSRSSSSAKLTTTTTNGHAKNDVEDVLSQFYHLNQFTHANLMVKHEDNGLAANDGHVNNMPSSSSSIVSQESPATMLSSCMHSNEMDDSVPAPKRRRTNNSIIETNHLHLKDIGTSLVSDNDDDVDEDGDDEEEERNTASAHQSSPIPTDMLYPFYRQQQQQQQQQQHQQQQQQQLQLSRLRKPSTTEQLDTASSTFSNPNDFLHTLYQHAAVARHTRTSEQLLGELVTTELLKMSKDRKKIAQKKILEVLFFDDD